MVTGRPRPSEHGRGGSCYMIPEASLGGWLRGLAARAHRNTVVVALAAKLARIVCAVLRSGKRFEMQAAIAS